MVSFETEIGYGFQVSTMTLINQNIWIWCKSVLGTLFPIPGAVCHLYCILKYVWPALPPSPFYPSMAHLSCHHRGLRARISDKREFVRGDGGQRQESIWKPGWKKEGEWGKSQKGPSINDFMLVRGEGGCPKSDRVRENWVLYINLNRGQGGWVQKPNELHDVIYGWSKMLEGRDCIPAWQA